MTARFRNSWTFSEIKDLIKNYDNPIQYLKKMFPRHSEESIKRKINRLRKEGKIGYKSEETVKEAYRLRHVQEN